MALSTSPGRSGILQRQLGHPSSLLMLSFLPQPLLVGARDLPSAWISAWSRRNGIRQHEVTTCVSISRRGVSTDFPEEETTPVGSFLEDPRGQEGWQMSNGTAPSPLRGRKGRALLAELFIFCQVLSGPRTVKVTQDLSLLSQLYISESQNRKDPQGSESKISSGRFVL